MKSNVIFYKTFSNYRNFANFRLSLFAGKGLG